MKWMNVWSYIQMDYRSWPSQVCGCVQRIRLHSSCSADQVRVHVSNQYGTELLVLDQVMIAAGTGTTVGLTFGGARRVAVPPGRDLVSDAAVIVIHPEESFEITAVMGRSASLTSGIVTYSRRELEVEVFDAGTGQPVKQAEVFSMVRDNPRMCYVFGISGVDFFCQDEARSVTAFGDSLTQQGFWVDHFKQRLRREGIARTVVLNRGIGGSRILKGTDPGADPYERHGRSGLERFETDCFGAGAPDAIIVFHGINDLITRHSPKSDYLFSTEDMITGLRRYAEIARGYGTPVWIATLTPLKRSIFYSDELEQERLLINEWIRSQSCYDGVIDFDRAVSEPADPAALDSCCDMGDGLHLSDEGGRRAAAVIDVEEMGLGRRHCGK